MPMTDAQRRASRKWDAAHYTQLPCKIRRDQAAAFRAACYANGTTPNAVLLSAVRGYMDTVGGWDAWMTAGTDDTGTSADAADTHAGSD